MSDSIIEVDHIVTPKVILEYTAGTYWIKIMDDGDMEYFCPNEPKEGALSGFIYRELWRYDTQDKNEALIIFSTLGKLMDRLYKSDRYIVKLKDKKSQGLATSVRKGG